MAYCQVGGTPGVYCQVGGTPCVLPVYPMVYPPGTTPGTQHPAPASTDTDHQLGRCGRTGCGPWVPVLGLRDRDPMNGVPRVGLGPHQRCPCVYVPVGMVNVIFPLFPKNNLEQELRNSIPAS